MIVANEVAISGGFGDSQSDMIIACYTALFICSLLLFF